MQLSERPLAMARARTIELTSQMEKSQSERQERRLRVNMNLPARPISRKIKRSLKNSKLGSLRPKSRRSRGRKRARGRRRRMRARNMNPAGFLPESKEPLSSVVMGRSRVLRPLSRPIKRRWLRAELICRLLCCLPLLRQSLHRWVPKSP